MRGNWSFLCVILSVLGVTYAQIPFSGQCPEITVQQNFKGDDFMGEWFSITKYPFAPAGNRKCNWALYDNLETENGNTTFRVTNGAFRLDTRTLTCQSC